MQEDVCIGLLLSAGSKASDVPRLGTEYSFVDCDNELTISLKCCHLLTQEREQLCFIVLIS